MVRLLLTKMKKVMLNRNQIQRLAVFLNLNENVNAVTIEETNTTGIGANHRAIYHCDKIERDWQEDITDVKNW